MVAERKIERIHIGQCSRGLDADGRIVNPHLRMVCTKPERDAVLPAQALPPHDKLEPAITMLQEQLVYGFGLVENREVELAGFGEGSLVRQNGRKIVQVNRGPTRGIVASVEAEIGRASCRERV